MALKKETKKTAAPKKAAPKKSAPKKAAGAEKASAPKKDAGPDWNLVRGAIRDADRTLSPKDIEDILLIVKEGEQALGASRWHWVWDRVKSLL